MQIPDRWTLSRENSVCLIALYHKINLDLTYLTSSLLSIFPFSFYFLYVCYSRLWRKSHTHIYVHADSNTHIYTLRRKISTNFFFNRCWKILTQAEVQGSPNYNMKVIKVLLMPNGILKVTLKVYDRTLHLTVVKEWQDRSILNCKRPQKRLGKIWVLLVFKVHIKGAQMAWMISGTK